MILEFDIIGQILHKKSNPCLANDTQNYLSLALSFDEAWDDYTNKYAIFTYKGKHYQTALLYDNEAEAYLQIVPKEVLKGKGFYVMCYGGVGDERITTNQVRIDLLESGYTTDITSFDYPDVQDPFTFILETSEEYTETQIKYSLNTLTNKIRGG